MNKLFLGLVVIIIAAGGWWFMNNKAPAGESAQDFGTYSYECDENVKFTMTPSADMSSIRVAPAGGGAYPPVSTLTKKEGTNARYEGNGVLFSGNGETVTLGEGDSAINCSPVPNPDSPPFNFGDGDAAGSVKQDTSLIVSESIQGKWQSTEDAKFVREFKADSVVEDWHDGKVVTSGLFVVFTKANAPKMVAFPIEENAVYIQMTTKGTQADTLNFKLVKMTSDELELIYMDRGGSLKFTRVQ
jgi:hypothetical protein